jgi:fluoride exporter
MPQLLWHCGLVAVGGALGAVARFLSARGLLFLFPAYIGAGTLAVNVVGSFLIGWVLGVANPRTLGDDWRIFLVPGFLGGFTTFSSLTYETAAMSSRHGGLGLGSAHLAANLILGLAAVSAGDALGRWLDAGRM